MINSQSNSLWKLAHLSRHFLWRLIVYKPQNFYFNFKRKMFIPTLMDFYRYTAFADWTCVNIVKYYRDKLERKDWEYILDKVKKDFQDITASKNLKKFLTPGRYIFINNLRKT
jgi:hypothetical protein